MKIIQDDLKSDNIAILLQQHHQEMLKHSPIESVHALDIEALRAPNITFFSAWECNELAGCGAIKALDETHTQCEIKSMRTAEGFLRRGVAAKILSHIIDVAKKKGTTELFLETGTMDAFKPATLLYQRFGFVECEPFADYSLDPYSLFMCKKL